MKLPRWLGGPDDGSGAEAEDRFAVDREREDRRRIREEHQPGRGDADRKQASAKRQPRHAGVAKAVGAFGTALRQGADETRGRSRGAPARLGGQLLAGAGVAFGIFFDLLGFVLNVFLAVAARVAGPVAWANSRLRSGTAAASRALTPTRALAAVAAGAAILLALSQFADYRGISIGTEAYAEVATVAPAPERERFETGSAHGYAMVPVAILSLALLLAAVRGGRWRLCRAVALSGLVAIAVGLIVDRPAGLDPGEAATVYEGVSASLLGGFYAQIFAGLLLAASALLLGRQLRLAGAASSARQEAHASQRNGVLHGATKPEGARA